MVENVIDGITKIYIRKYGQEKKGKKTILCVHGWTSQFEQNPIFLDALAKKYIVYTISLPGYYKSPFSSIALTLEGLCDCLSMVIKTFVKPPEVLLGFSMGTQVVATFVKKFSFKGKIIFIGAPCERLAPSWAKTLLSTPGFLYLARNFRPLTSVLTNYAARQVEGLTNAKKGKSFFQESVHCSLEGAFDSLVAQVRDFTDILFLKDLALFIYGSKDNLCQKSLELGIKPIILEGAYHYPFHSHSNEILRTMIQYIDKNDDQIKDQPC